MSTFRRVVPFLNGAAVALILCLINPIAADAEPAEQGQLDLDAKIELPAGGQGDDGLWHWATGELRFDIDQVPATTSDWTVAHLYSGEHALYQFKILFDGSAAVVSGFGIEEDSTLPIDTSFTYRFRNLIQSGAFDPHQSTTQSLTLRYDRSNESAPIITDASISNLRVETTETGPGGLTLVADPQELFVATDESIVSFIVQGEIQSTQCLKVTVTFLVGEGRHGDPICISRNDKTQEMQIAITPLLEGEIRVNVVVENESGDRAAVAFSTVARPHEGAPSSQYLARIVLLVASAFVLLGAVRLARHSKKAHSSTL